ncbi:MAG TPA: LysR substrate-binding domain-containing protein [Dongiaceae bacterium]|jgi:LysR family glycine cleavage system transcriptional activator|nr:LysR substrate-binding domain-containing protein [Dongiaceae bacterium]
MRKPPRLPALTALRAFEAAARLGSVTAAAVELSVTQGAISRQIRLLEEDLQQPVFRRLHRGIELTMAGQKLSASLTDAFGQIGYAVADLKRPHDVVSLKAVPTFAIRWLLPRLAEFNRAHPAIKLEVSTAWHGVELDKEDFDCGITGCDQPRVKTPQFIWVELIQEVILPVCTPDYVRKMRAPHTAADFARHNLLHPTPDRSDWRVWMEGWGGGRFDVSRGQTFDTIDLAIRAAESGLGVAIAELSLLADQIELGQLITPVPIAVPTGLSNWFVCRPNIAERPAVRLFRDWLIAEAAKTKEWSAAWLARNRHRPTVVRAANANNP